MDHATLLEPDEPPPYRIENALGRSPFVLTCDHASRALPRKLGSLGLDARALESHIAWDLGAAALGAALALRLDAPLALQGYSRLVIDANRPPGSPDSIVTVSEGTPISGNLNLSPEQVEARRRAIFEPYHASISDLLERRAIAGQTSVLVALHSFTPRFFGVDRIFHAGVLYGRDARLGRLLLEELRRETQLAIGDNEPYAVSDETDHTVITHGERRGLVHVELEIRQDLLATADAIAAWCERLGKALEVCFSRLFPL
jgi:predicted N-formylglutamate amidohydrolase